MARRPGTRPQPPPKRSLARGRHRRRAHRRRGDHLHRQPGRGRHRPRPARPRPGHRSRPAPDPGRRPRLHRRHHHRPALPLFSTNGRTLGDRACLALARRLHAPAVTAEHLWANLDLYITIDHSHPPDLTPPGRRDGLAHDVALDVNLGLARTLTAPWISTDCDTPITWALLRQLVLEGSPPAPLRPVPSRIPRTRPGRMTSSPPSPLGATPAPTLPWARLHVASTDHGRNRSSAARSAPARPHVAP